MKRPRWACFEALIALVLIALPVGAMAQEAVRIERAEFVLADLQTPPSDSADWQPVGLPDVWTATRPGVSGHAWYRLQFDLPAQPQGRQALYFERLRTVGAAFVNGQEVGQYGEFGVATLGPRPQLFDFAPALLRPGRNTLQVHLWVQPGWEGALSPVHIGPRESLAAAVERERFLHVTVSQWAAVIGAVLGAMMLVTWLGRRRDTMFGWFALGALAKSTWIAWSLGAVPWLGSLGTALLVVPIFVPLSIYCLRYAGWHWPRFERALWALAIGYALHLAVSRLVLQENLLPDPVVKLWLLSFYVAPLALALMIVRRRPDLESIALVLAHLLSVLISLHALLVDPLTGLDPWTTHTLPVYLAMAWILTRRFVRSLNETESLNADLEQRVAAKHAELQANYERLHLLEQQQAVAAERSRITSDMHDGIGGQLISTLSLVEHGQASTEQVVAALRECIDDLRLAIDSLEPSDQELLPVLGNLRYRLEPRLRAQGITLDWQVNDVPRLACLTPQNVLHVLRIVQEAFTNALKHAKPRCIRVATSTDERCVAIDVSDDGAGFDAATPGRDAGRGIANMRKRALAIGAELRLRSSGQGTTLSLLLPVG